MPYIKEDSRLLLDQCIEHMVNCLKDGAFRVSGDPEKHNLLKPDLSNEDLLAVIGDINYTFSRVLGGVMGKISYSKIALITGVLENIKQEFYRRAATSYEDQKILANGDIPEYKKLN